MKVLIQDGKVVQLIDGDLPELPPLYDIIEYDGFVQVGWSWDGVNFSYPPELEDEVRTIRNECLKESDSVVARFVLAGEEVPQSYIDFRQALRDLPEQDGFPYDVSYPEHPEIEIPYGPY